MSFISNLILNNRFEYFMHIIENVWKFSSTFLKTSKFVCANLIGCLRGKVVQILGSRVSHRAVSARRLSASVVAAQFGSSFSHVTSGAARTRRGGRKKVLCEIAL